VVIGVGNPLRGDDGVGLHVIEALRERVLPGDVKLVDGGTEGLGLVLSMQGRRRAIVVDAVDMGKRPGAFDRFPWHGSEAGIRFAGEDEHLGVHEAGLRDALRLAEALRVLPEEVIVFGIQPASLAWEPGLSPEAEEAVDGVVDAILAEVSG
jgi:hydrogenase maturation protease